MFTSSISLLPSFYSMEVARLDSIRSTELEARNGKFSPQAAKWQLSPAWHIWWRESSHIFENVFGSTTFSSSLPLPRFDSAMVQSAISVMGNIEAQSQDCELRRPDRNLGISPWSAWQKSSVMRSAKREYQFFVEEFRIFLNHLYGSIEHFLYLDPALRLS